MIRSRTFTVKEGGVRLDAALLLHFPTSTRAFVREAVEAGGVLVDGRRAAKGLKLRGGETIDVRSLAEASDNTVAPDPAVDAPCVFEDESLLAYDKPGRVCVDAVHGAGEKGPVPKRNALGVAHDDSVHERSEL